jgi:anti-sigma B factor antagonist
MPLDITHEAREGIEILSLHGQLTFGQEDLDFRQELDHLIQAGKINVVVNLSHLSKLDTTGVGTLLFAAEKLKEAGGNLAIFNTKQSPFELPVEVQLETALKVFPTEQDALGSFFPDEDVKHFDVLELVESMKKPEPPET